MRPSCRKSSKVREAGTSKLVQIEADTGSASSSYQLSEDDGVNDSPRTPASSKLATVSVFLCPLCGRSFKNPEQKDRHVAKCAQSKNVNEKTLLAAEELQKRQIAERLSLGLPPCNVMKSAERRPRRCGNREIDPSDLSLAIAMSESLQSASEDARRKEEELLITVKRLPCNFSPNYVPHCSCFPFERRTWQKLFRIYAKKK